MLVSDRNRFIFLRPIKTAGTSVEKYLARSVFPDARNISDIGNWPEHSLELPEGIISSEYGEKPGEPYWNHMPAAAVRAAIGADRFDRYLKISIARDPLDQTISRFWWGLREHRAIRWTLSNGPFWSCRSVFSLWVRQLSRTGRLNRNFEITHIDGQLIIDRLLRFEHLEEDLAALCAELEIEFNADELEKTKTGFRFRNEDVTRWYSPSLLRLMQHAFVDSPYMQAKSIPGRND